MQTIKKPVRILLIASGTLLAGVGLFGIFVPVLPTTPFLLLSATLYARSSDRFYNLLVNNKIFGKFIKDYREGKGIKPKIKAITIILLWLTIGCSAFFAVDILWIKILLVLIAVGVTVHIIMIKKSTKNRP